MANPAVQKAVLKVIEKQPASLSDIHKEISWWTRETIHETLRDLLADGQVTTTGPAHHQLYFKV